MVKSKECPRCGKHTIEFNPVKNLAYCKRSVCGFVERVEDKLDFEEKYRMKNKWG